MVLGVCLVLIGGFSDGSTHKIQPQPQPSTARSPGHPKLAIPAPYDLGHTWSHVILPDPPYSSAPLLGSTARSGSALRNSWWRRMKGRTRSAFEVVWRLPFLVRYTNHVFLFSKNELSLQPKLGSRKSRAHVRSSIQHFTSRLSVHNVWTRHGPSQVMDKLQMVEGEAPSRAEWMMKQHMGTSLDFSERCSTSYTYI